MDTISKARAHGGTQGVYKHDAQTGMPMTFAVFVPPKPRRPGPGAVVPVGLTCTHANVMDKGEYGRRPPRMAS